MPVQGPLTDARGGSLNDPFKAGKPRAVYQEVTVFIASGEQRQKHKKQKVPTLRKVWFMRVE